MVSDVGNLSLSDSALDSEASFRSRVRSSARGGDSYFCPLEGSARLGVDSLRLTLIRLSHGGLVFNGGGGGM